VVTRHTEREIEGRALSLSNLDKVLFPDAGFTKGDLIDYYVAIAPVMLPYLEDRPMTMKRYPDGVAKKFFYEKHAPPSSPQWMRSVSVPTADGHGTIDYLIVDNRASLVWAANLGTIEFHVPLWHVGRRRKLPGRPDSIVFDLDPGPGTSIVECCEVALSIRERLDVGGFVSRAKTSGSKGLQLYGAPKGTLSWDGSRTLARGIAEELAGAHPELVTANMRRDRRREKILIDWSQNQPAKTTVGAYSVRGMSRPTVSTPVTWDEIAHCAKTGDPKDLVFTTSEVSDRVDTSGDLFAY